jgi:hypothetical protein
MSCDKKKSFEQSNQKSVNINELNKKKRKTVKPSDLSSEGFNWIHYDLAIIYSGMIYEHHLKGKVRLEKLENKKNDLEKYLITHEQVSEKDFKKWDDEKRLSFLLNTYHASLLYLMAKNKSLSLPRKELSKANTVKVFGRSYSILGFVKDELETNYKNPYIYVSLKCFKPKCPEFRNSIYNFKNVTNMLKVSAKRYFMEASNFVVDSKNKSIIMPFIFKLYAPLRNLSEAEAKKLISELAESKELKNATLDPKFKLIYEKTL